MHALYITKRSYLPSPISLRSLSVLASRHLDRSVLHYMHVSTYSECQMSCIYVPCLEIDCHGISIGSAPVVWWYLPPFIQTKHKVLRGSIIQIVIAERKWRRGSPFLTRTWASIESTVRFELNLVFYTLLFCRSQIFSFLLQSSRTSCAKCLQKITSKFWVSSQGNSYPLFMQACRFCSYSMV